MHVARLFGAGQRREDREAAPAGAIRGPAEARGGPLGVPRRDLDQVVAGRVADVLVDARQVLELDEHDRERPAGGAVAPRPRATS